MVKRAALWFSFCVIIMLVLQLDATALGIASVLTFVIAERTVYNEMDDKTRR